MNPCIPCIALSFVCLAGCSKKQAEPDAAAAPPGTIAVSHTPGFADIANRILTAATNVGFEVFSVRDDESLPMQRVDAVVVCSGRTRVVAAGTPVFSVDIDYDAGGRLAADAMRVALAGSGKVAILDRPGEESAVLHTLGFQERLRPLNAAGDGEIHVVAQLPGRGTRAQSFQSTQVMLQAQGGLNGILAVNEASALGAMDALKEADRSDQVAIVCFADAPLDAAFATIVPQPIGIGTNTVETIQQFLRGESTVREILIPMKSVRGRTLP